MELLNSFVRLTPSVETRFIASRLIVSRGLLTLKQLIILSVIILAAVSCGGPSGRQEITPPIAEQIEQQLVIHGDTRIDPYYWMNDREDPAVIRYLEAENAYREAMMAHTEGLQQTLFNEMRSRIKEDDTSAPFMSNGYYYYTRYETGQEYPIYCRKMGSLEAAEEVLLNVNELAVGHPYYRVGSYDVSLDNKLMAFSIDTVGRRQYTIHIKDLESGEITPTNIQHAAGDIVWAADNATFFFTKLDPATLRYISINRSHYPDMAAPVEVYFEQDETFYNIGVSRSKDNRYLMIQCNSTLSDETYLLASDNPMGQFTVFQPRQDDLLYSVIPWKDRFYVLTNYQATNFRLMEVPMGKATGVASWRERIAHRPEVLIEGLEVFNDFMVLQERSKGLRQLRVINQTNREEHYIAFKEEAYTVGISTNAEMASGVLRYSYTSMTTPGSTYDYDMTARETTLIKQQEVPGGFDAGEYVTRRLYAPGRDGAQVPITIVHRKDIVLDGSNPLLLYGYGSYGYSQDPRFSSNLLSLLDRGFVYALAHIRGGQDLGRQWYDDGKLLKKRNTFYDFIDCGKYLVDQGYTNSDVLFASGGSAGGLLVGAVVNMAPELFKGAIASVPFVDVVTTMLDESIPLTTAEYDEWGNPNVKEYYEYMLSYSPYDNVQRLSYPNLYITSGLHDSQVQYWEPTKWVAKLRQYHTGESLILLDTNLEAGHGGASGRFRRLNEIARQYAFLLDLAGK
jgi:oligopeptidase B